MATLVNRDVVVKDVDGTLRVGRCVGQSATEYWIKVMLPDGSYLMSNADDFVRVADALDCQVAVALRGIEGACKALPADSAVLNHLAIAKGIVAGFICGMHTANASRCGDGDISGA
jgi:hypothetical protein